MAVNLTSPVTGAAQTGFTSPTYTITSDTAPNASSRQWAVTALGGTQTGVTISSVSSPFTVTIERPAAFRQLSQPNPVTGVVSNVPRNKYVMRVRKGVTPLSGQNPQVLLAEAVFWIPAGSDTADTANVRAALSLLGGAIAQTSAGLGDTVTSGVM